MLVGITLDGGGEAPEVRIIAMPDGRKFLSLVIGRGVSVNMASYDAAGADAAYALADALYEAADKLRPADVPLVVYSIAQELEQ